MVSCIIPFHNENARIDFVLEVLTQSKNIDEIICVNDASTDGGEKNLLKKFPSIRLIHTKTNSGKSHAIKLGLDKAIGSYILLMDADLMNNPVPRAQGIKDYNSRNCISSGFFP